MRTGTRGLLILCLLCLSLLCGGADLRADSGREAEPSQPSSSAAVSEAGHAMDRMLLLADREGSYSLTPSFLYLEDPSGAITLAEAVAAAEAGGFTAPPEGKPSFGYTGSAYWVRFTAVNGTADQGSWILRINYSWFRSVRLYAPTADAGSTAAAGADTGYTMRETGYRMPVSTRDIKARQFLFDLYIPPGESRTYYLRFSTTDLMILDMTLSSSRAYLAEDHESQLWYGIFFGILLIMVLFNLLLFIFLKEKSYLYFSLFIFFAVVHLLQESCLFYEYLHALPDWLKFERYFIYQSAMVFFGILFTVSFLDIRRKMPLIHTICVILGAFCVATIPMNILLTDAILEAFSMALWITAIAVSILAAAITMARKTGAALFFAVGWGPFIVGTVLAATINSDSVLMSPHDFVDRYGQLAGISLSALLFSAALADRYRGIRREKEIAAEVNLRQKEFFINLAHETKTPLTLIRNYLDEYISAHGTTRELAVIKGNIDKLLQDMVNFFDLQRLSMGKGISGESVVVNLSAYLREKQDIAAQTARISGLSLAGDIQPGLHVHADPLALERIVNNLLENAFKYNPSGGHVSLTLSAAGKNARLTVTDDGPGIPEDKLETIFVPYYQVSGKKKNIQGIGLGLVIARGAAWEMGGTSTRRTTGTAAARSSLPYHCIRSPQANKPSRSTVRRCAR